jgi:DNA polymerase III sliding clamp (beta) subunit (PCNA family)
VAHDHLTDRLALLKTVLVRRAHRKDLSTVHVEVKPDGSATIAATDMEIGLQLRLDVLRFTGVGRVMIDAHALDAMLGGYPEPRVRIHLDDTTQIRVEGTQAKFTLPGADPAKELKLTAPGSLTSSGWMVRADQLVSAILRTRFAVDDGTSTRYALAGLAMFFPPEGQEFLEIVATDGRRLSLVRLPVRAHGKEPARLWKPVPKNADPNVGVPVVVNKAVNTLLRIAREAGNSSLGLSVIPGEPIDLEKGTFKDGRIQAVTRDAVLTAKMPEGRYPNWRSVIPTDETKCDFTLKFADKLGTLIASASAATDSENKGVEMVMANGVVMLSSESETKGKSQVSLVGLEMNGRGTVTIDGAWLRQFFDVIGDTPLQVKFYGPAAPMVFHAGADHDFILMPLARDTPARPAPKPAPEKKPEGDGGGDANAEPPKPEPPIPVGATPDAHKGNGRAKAAAK